jgi:hypothetical protein
MWRVMGQTCVTQDIVATPRDIRGVSHILV